MYLLSATRRTAYLTFLENKNHSDGFSSCETASSNLPPNILISPCVLIFRDRHVYPDGHVVFIHPSHKRPEAMSSEAPDTWYIADCCTANGSVACITESWMVLLMMMGCEVILYPKTKQRTLQIEENVRIPRPPRSSSPRAPWNPQSPRTKSRFKNPQCKARKPWRSLASVSRSTG
jgi:hypothetical protein